MLAKCQVLLKDRHSSERLLRCWGGHAGLDLKATQASIMKLLQVRLKSSQDTALYYGPPTPLHSDIVN